MKNTAGFILICFILISCIKTNNISSPAKINELPKLEISKNNIFAEFPNNPEYFNKNDIDVKIIKYDRQSPSEWRGYGINQVHVFGDNFFIIYENDADKVFETMLVILYGESIFTYWDQYFFATWDDVRKSWGEPSIEGSRAYIDNTGWYGVVFTEINTTTKKIEEIRISKVL